MGILVECPACRKRSGLKKKECKCGYNVQKAGYKNYWIEYYLEGKRTRERIGRSNKLLRIVFVRYRRLKLKEGI